MKKIILPFLMMLLFTVYTSAVSADMTGSNALSVSLSNYDPNPAIAGDTVDVRIGIQNTGGIDTSDLIMEVVPSYPFELVPGESAIQDVGIVPGYQADSSANIRVVKYTLQVNKDAPAGSYELKVKYYNQGSTDAVQKSLYMDVKSKESAEVIQIDKSTLVPGKLSNLKFTINNMGNAPLRDLTFYWENDDKVILPVGSDNTKYIKYIDIGKSADLEYQVIADTNAQPGLYKLNLHLNYEDSILNQTKQITTIAGVYVGGGTDFDVAFSDNANGETSFSVANIGSNPAYSVSVVIPDQIGWSVSGSNSIIIGNLNKGDYTVASFKLQSAMDAFQNRTGGRGMNATRYMQRSTNSGSSQDTVHMQIAYTDTMGERMTIDKQVKIGFQNMASADGQTGFQGSRGQMQQASVMPTYVWYFLGITALVGGVVVQRKYKSRKLVDPSFKMMNLFGSKKMSPKK